MLKPLIRDVIYRTGWILGQSKPKLSSRNRLTVVTFHRVLTDAERGQYMHRGLAVTPQELDWICQQLTNHYECGPLSEMHTLWSKKEHSKKPLLAITFDDGQLDNFTNARPVLNKYNLKATFYIPVQNINNQQLIWHDQLGFACQAILAEGRHRTDLLKLAKCYGIEASDNNNLIGSMTEQAKALPPEQRSKLVEQISELCTTEIPSWAHLMNWEQIKQLANEGHEIGSHSMTHEIIPQLTDDMLQWEITESKKQIETRLNTPIKSFCYPNGDNDSRCRQAAKDAGYQNAVTTNPGTNNMPKDHYALSRCDINAQYLTGRNCHLSADRLFFRITRAHDGLR